MPNRDHAPIETDGDARTIYEDTTPHTRSGFMPEQPDVTSFESDDRDADQDAART